jgi:hypothetical protein
MYQNFSSSSSSDSDCSQSENKMTVSSFANINANSISQSMMLPQRASLIDNTFAQFCMVKRQRASSQSTATSSHPPFRKSHSDSTIFNKSGTKFTYKNHSKSMPSANAIKFISSLPVQVSTEGVPAPPITKQEDNLCPSAFIQSLVDENGTSSDSTDETTMPLHETEFIPPSEEQIEAYNTDVVSAIRAGDISNLRNLYSQGQTFSCCNRFGESLLHVACRRSNADVVSFLLHEAHVSPRIKDDFGRTPLHDACWRGNPEFEIVELLLGVEPRLAFVADVRGHRPFQYARREHWGAWREYLDRQRDLILPPRKQGEMKPEE